MQLARHNPQSSGGNNSAGVRVASWEESRTFKVIVHRVVISCGAVCSQECNLKIGLKPNFST